MSSRRLQPPSQRCSLPALIPPQGRTITTTTKAGLEVEVLQSWAAFQALRDDWNGLLRRSASDCVFLTWEWIRAWADLVEDRVRPLVVVARTGDGELVGAAPFYRTEMRLAGVIPYRTLRIMGDHPTGAEYLDWPIAGGREEEVAAALARGLAGAAGAWDCIWMPRVSGWSGARERLRHACREAGFRWHERESLFSAVPLPPSMDEYRGLLSRENRRDLRRDSDKILRRQGARVVRCQTADEMAAFLEALFELHHRRWKARGEEGSFRRKPLLAGFYRRFAPIALARGWLRIHGLKENGSFKAVQVGYAYNGVYYALQDGFDPTYLPGAGNVLRAGVVEACIAEGLREYDFLGGLNDYKRRWLARPRVGYDLFIGRPGVRNALLFAREVWPSGRYLRPCGPPDGP